MTSDSLLREEAELVGGPMDGRVIKVPRCRSDELPLRFLRVERWQQPHRREGRLIGAYERGQLSEDTHRWRYEWRELAD